MHKLRQLNNWLRKHSYVFLFFIFFAHSLQAAAVTEQINFSNYLAQEKTHIQKSLEELKQQSLPKNEAEYNSKIIQLNSFLTLTKAKLETLNGFWDNQNKLQAQYLEKLKHLQQLPIISNNKNNQDRVIKTQQSLADNKQLIAKIEENSNLALQFQQNIKTKIKELNQWKVNFKLEEKLTIIKNNRTQLQKKLQSLYLLASTEKKQAKATDPINIEAKSLLNSQQVALIQLELNDLKIQRRVIRANKELLTNSDSKTLQAITEVYTDAIAAYDKIITSLQQMIQAFQNEATLTGQSDFKNSLKSFQQAAQSQLKQAKERKQLLSLGLTDYQNQLKKIISARQSLSEYRMDTWPIIMHKIMAIPGLFYKYIKGLALKVYDSYKWLNFSYASLLWVIFGIIVTVFFILNRLITFLSSDRERSSLTGYLYDGFLTLLQRNLLYLCLFTLILTVFFYTNIPYSNYELLFNLFLVWFITRILILIARLVLLERVSDSSGKDVKLYYRIKWMLLFGGWATALMTFSHLAPLSILLQDMFNRLFMLFLLTVALVAWKSKDVIPDLIRPVLISKKNYVKNAISLLVILIPITLFTTAVLGLFGFVNLAWIMSRYQAYILIVLIGYILARGLLFDALELFSEWMISTLNNGWLWIEVFLKPLDTILRLILILISIGFLFQLFGWYDNSLVMLNLHKVAKYKLVDITGIHITVESIIEFILLVAFFVWASKWTREFCYRWLYINTKDAGVRNSLSVFTQYGIILLGACITLLVLGLDFGGMSMILGGLAVGMGFGLKDFANNIVGGIMLLIERPVREGDLITLGEHEGQVAHIGIRSMRVSTWDNTEVLIPNAETFNKPFTNWTHQDGIVRTVVPIKVSRVDDPVMVQQLILDVLAIIPEIVSEPPVQVYLKKIDEALIEFEVRYFINVHLYTRYEVRSKVLFAIMAQFKAAGIRHPVDPITIEFKEGTGDLFANTTRIKDRG